MAMQKKPPGGAASWFVAAVGLLILGLVTAAGSRGRAPAPVITGQSPNSTGSDSHQPPQAAAPKPERQRDHPYVFLWIWEDNSAHAFKGFTIAQGVPEAAGYNEKTQAMTVYQSVDLDPDIRLLVLTEASSGDVLLFSRLHPVRELPWSYAIPDLEWAGVYLDGPHRGETANMVANEHRYLRGPVEVLSVDATGVIQVRYGAETFDLKPGEGRPIVAEVDPDQGLYSRLIIYHQGVWNLKDVRLAAPSTEGGQLP